MVMVRPFKAYRPIEEYVKQVAALPYDVMSLCEAKKMVAENPYSFLHIDKPEINIKDEQNQEIYQFASDRLDEMIHTNIFKQDEVVGFYIYGIHTPFTIQYGIVGCVSCEEYDTGLIKKHENTRADKEQDRTLHISFCKAHTGPIFLAYKGFKSLGEWVDIYTQCHEPQNDFYSEDGVRHVVYVVNDKKDIHYIQHTFQKIQELYIADGHHRAAAACNYARVQPKEMSYQEDLECNYFLAAIYPKDQLCIMGYNRVLKDESGLSEEQLFDKLKEYFEVRQIEVRSYQPEVRHTLGMRYKGRWYALRLKEGIVNEEDVEASLDVSILQDYILSPIFKIDNPREDKRIDFVGGIRGVEELNRRTEEDMDIAFSVYPTQMDELIGVADEGKLMPPKSTWFEPKLRSGLFIHKF